MIIENLSIDTQTISLKKPFKTAVRTATAIETIKVTLELENGVVGKGSASPTMMITGESAPSIQMALQEPIRNALIGHAIDEWQALTRTIQTCCVGNTGAKAAADMALYDAASRLFNVPLHTMLGGSQPLNTSMTVGVDEPGNMAADAKQCLTDGFSRLKIKVGAQPEEDIARIQAIQEVVPSSTVLRLDANQGWTPKQAVRLINQMERLSANIEFIEQPVAAHDLLGLKFVTEHVNTPIMADESLFSPEDALILADGGYVDLLNIKLLKSGGITNARKIADIAETSGIPCMMGSMMESAHSVTAAAHLAAAHPNIHYIDLDAPIWLAEEPESLTYQGEKLTLSTTPGI